MLFILWNFYNFILLTVLVRAAGTSDATILVFGIRYDIDTILPKYRDIDTMSIFYKYRK